LLSEAQSDPSKVSEFTGFANSYLDFISDYGDPKATEQVLNDLFALQGGVPDPVSMADEITGGKTLSDLYEILGQIEGWESETAIYTKVNAEQAYLSANLDVANAVQQGNFASGLEHYGMYGENEGRQYGGLTPGFELDKADEGLTLVQREQNYLSSYLDVAAAVQRGEFATGLQHYQMYGADEGRAFKDGGIISGPMSGYTVPTTFHGTEHITTDSDMKGVVKLLQQLVNKNVASGEGNIEIKVMLDGKEMKAFTAKTIRTDSETQTQIRRVARV
jgi:hypothetical protein